MLNDCFAARVAACVGAGEVVRLRQPVDLRRFSVSNRRPAPRPTRALLLGNYHGQPGSRAQSLKDAMARGKAAYVFDHAGADGRGRAGLLTGSLRRWAAERSC